MHLLLLPSPVGPLLARYESGGGLRSLSFWRQGEHPPAGTRDAPSRGDLLGARIAEELAEYFAGRRREFTLPLYPEGTEFQLRVWKALLEVPYGETRSYLHVATSLGSPGAARAVGQANARNPLPIVIPCHRVLPTSGGLGGYLGSSPEGGGWIKRRLLELEGAATFEF